MIRKQMAILLGVCSIGFFPLSVLADITVYNNTSSSATAFVKDSPCSSELGNDGVAKPGKSLKIPHIVFTKYCGFSTCDAHIFPTANCAASGKELATVTIDGFKGEIKSVNNRDKDHYDIQHGKNSMTVTEKRSFKDWLQSLFSKA